LKAFGGRFLVGTGVSSPPTHELRKEIRDPEKGRCKKPQRAMGMRHRLGFMDKDRRNVSS
jgi:hypothetical protein